MIEAGFVLGVSDIFTLHEKRSALLQLPRMGEKKLDNLIENIEIAKNKAPLSKILFAFGIPNVGETICKQLAKKYKTVENIAYKSTAELEADGFTQVVAKHIPEFFNSEENRTLLENLHKAGLK